MSAWAERKAARTDYFWRFVYGWKQRPCAACGGTGFYDNSNNPVCAACQGSGKERYRSTKEKK